MVKKGSILGRLADRFRTSGPIKVEAARGDAGASVPVEKVQAQALPAAADPAEARTQRKLSEREEAMALIGERFSELSSLLRGVHTRMDSQMGRLVDAAESMQQLPALSRQQLDMLTRLGVQMDRQNALGEQLAATLQSLPSLLNGVELALQRSQQSDERTAQMVQQFSATMTHMQDAMGKMVQHSEQQHKATAELVRQRDESLQELRAGIESSQQQAVSALRASAEDTMQSLRRANEDQSSRLHRIVEQQGRMNRVAVVGLGVAVLATIATVALLMLK